MKDNSVLLFVAGGAAGAIAACAALHVVQRRSWNARSHRYDESTSGQQRSVTPTVAPDSSGLNNFLDDEILAEQFTRNVQFFGQEGQLKIANAFVVVIGLGVSAYACCNLYCLLSCIQPCRMD